MTIEVDIPPRLLERIERAAEATGSDVPTLVRQAVETAFASVSDEAPQRRPETWITDLRSWAASRPRCEHPVDDSRERNYEMRR